MRIEIHNLQIQELDIYARDSEVALLRKNEPGLGLFIAESPKVIERALGAGYEPISFLMEEESRDDAGLQIVNRFPKLPCYVGNRELLSGITGFQLTRGMLCAMKRKQHTPLQQLLSDAKRIAVLENVVNPTNVGAIFRSAAALNMDAVILTQGCADPLYRRCARVSMGTVFQVPWTFLPKGCELSDKGMDMLKEIGFQTVAMALKEDSYEIDDSRIKKEEKLAVILGTEGEGLAEATISKCDYTVMIPMSHGVDSLNVAAASAVAFWELGNKNKQ